MKALHFISFFRFVKLIFSIFYEKTHLAFFAPVFGAWNLCDFERLFCAFSALFADYASTFTIDCYAMSAARFFMPLFCGVCSFRFAENFRFRVSKKNKKGAEFFAPRPQIFGKIVAEVRAILRFRRFWVFRFCSNMCRRRFCAIRLLYRLAEWGRRFSHSLRRSWV